MEDSFEFKIKYHCKGNYMYLIGDPITGLKIGCTCGAIISLEEYKKLCRGENDSKREA